LHGRGEEGAGRGRQEGKRGGGRVAIGHHAEGNGPQSVTHAEQGKRDKKGKGRYRGSSIKNKGGGGGERFSRSQNRQGVRIGKIGLSWEGRTVIAATGRPTEEEKKRTSGSGWKRKRKVNLKP